jgi:hypothetical protein
MVPDMFWWEGFTKTAIGFQARNGGVFERNRRKQTSGAKMAEEQAEEKESGSR